MPAKGKATSKFNMKMKKYGNGKSPFKGFFGDLAKGKGALGLINPMGAIASKTGLLMKDKSKKY